MLKNYLKTAWHSLMHNKLYLFVSLFGISFTLMVLMIAMSVVDSETGKHPPLTKKDRIVTTITLQMRKWQRDQVVTIDTTYLEDGTMVLDSIETEEINKNNYVATSNSYISDKLIVNYLENLKTPELMTKHSFGGQLDVFSEGEFLKFSCNYSDQNFFKIFDYEFIEGSPFDQQDVENQANVIVMNQSSARKYFGPLDSYLGKQLKYLNKQYEVVGIIKDVKSSTLDYDTFLPYTQLTESQLNDENGFFGGLIVAWLLHSPDDKDALSQELRNVEAQIDDNLPNEMDVIRFVDKDTNNALAMLLFWDLDKNTYWKLQSIFLISLSLFVLIPVMNLMSLNTNQIMERSDEIGVRKAFGATSGKIMSQFIIENILLTFLGGLLGLAFTFLAIRFLNSNEIFGKLTLSFHPNVFLSSFLLILGFGILSGIIPAWKTSRLPIASALKSN